MNGLENIGIRLELEDFKSIYDIVDHDQKGEIDFNKFCLLNADRARDIKDVISDIKNHDGSPPETASKKPPLHSLRTNGTTVRSNSKNYQTSLNIIPKNKDLGKFNDDVQEMSHNEFCKKKRRIVDLPSGKDRTFVYGTKNV